MEVSPRPHDTGMATMITQRQDEFRCTRGLSSACRDTGPHRQAPAPVIYGGVDGEGIAFRRRELALAVPNSEIRLFWQPVSYLRRRMAGAGARRRY